MNKKYIALLISAFMLTACGSDAESPTNTAQQSDDVSSTEVKQEIATNDLIPETSSTEASKAKGSQQKTADASEIKPELPLGRLTGIIDTGTYKQAIIDDQGKVIRLKEGGDWQGWLVTAIHREKITVKQGDEVHSLLLLTEFRSPQLTETELNNQANQEQNKPEKNVQQANDSSTQKFTEEQLTELRSRLLIGR